MVYLSTLKYKKSILLSCLHHFKSDAINNMDHIRNSDTELSSVILIQTKWYQKRIFLLLNQNYSSVALFNLIKFKNPCMPMISNFLAMLHAKLKSKLNLYPFPTVLSIDLRPRRLTFTMFVSYGIFIKASHIAGNNWEQEFRLYRIV